MVNARSMGAPENAPSIEAGSILSLAMTSNRKLVARMILVGAISTGTILAAAVLATSITDPAAAQPSRRRTNQPVSAFEHDPDLDAQDQLAPSRIQQQSPDAGAMPSGGSRARTRAAAHGNDAAVEPSAAA